MEAAFRAILTGDSAVAALVSTRIYWNGFPQSVTDPAIALYKISGAPGYTTKAPDNLEGSRVQLDVRARTFASAIAVGNAVKAKLSGFSGVQSGLSFRGVFIQSERQSRELPGKTLYHRISFDFDVWHKPSS